MRQVEVDHRLTIDAEMVLVDNLVDGARRDIAGDEVPVLRVPLLQEVKTLALGDALPVALVTLFLWNPHAAAFTASGLGHETKLVFSGDRSRVNLNEFAVRVERALLIQS